MIACACVHTQPGREGGRMRSRIRRVYVIAFFGHKMCMRVLLAAAAAAAVVVVVAIGEGIGRIQSESQMRSWMLLLLLVPEHRSLSVAHLCLED